MVHHYIQQGRSFRIVHVCFLLYGDRTSLTYLSNLCHQHYRAVITSWEQSGVPFLRPQLPPVQIGGVRFIELAASLGAARAIADARRVGAQSHPRMDTVFCAGNALGSHFRGTHTLRVAPPL